MTKEFAIEYIQEGCLSCPEYDTANKECISNSHCFEVKRYAIKAIKALNQEPCGDAISRQAVLKAIDGWYDNNRDTENIEDLIVLITYMSSVHPIIEDSDAFQKFLKDHNYVLWTKEQSEDVMRDLHKYLDALVKIKAEIEQTVKEEADDERWSRGLHYALKIIDRHLGKETDE